MRTCVMFSEREGVKMPLSDPNLGISTRRFYSILGKMLQVVYNVWRLAIHPNPLKKFEVKLHLNYILYQI